MKIIEPTIEYLHCDNEVDHVARCARVCYASAKTTDNRKFWNMLIHNKHNSIFRHVPVYYIIPVTDTLTPGSVNSKGYIDAEIRLDYLKPNGLSVAKAWYVSTNLQCAMNYWDKIYPDCRISIKEAEEHPVFKFNKMLRYTFVVNTGIDITREYNRKSPNNIAEQSTRYVDFIKKIGIRFKRCYWMDGLNIYKRCLVYIMAKISELFYKISRSKYGLNLKPQDARWILPLDIMSKAVYTYTVKDWEYIINMRLFDWTGVAHPDAKVVARQIYYKLESLGYTINNYSNTELKQ